jgi:hypothetical protein
VKELSAEPGFGFVTLCPFTEDGGDPEEHLIVPIGAVTRITLGRPEGKRADFGFTPPSEPK